MTAGQPAAPPAIDPRLKQAQEALKTGRMDEGLALLVASLTDAPGPAGAYRALAVELLRRSASASAEEWVRRGLDIHPSNAELLNVLGVVLKRQARMLEAAEALEEARRIDPSPAVLQNLANVYTGIQDERGIAVCRELLALDPDNGEYNRLMGVALYGSEEALPYLRRATQLMHTVSPWLDLVGALSALHRYDEALADVEAGMARLPELGEAKAVLLRRSGRDPRPFLMEHLDQPWAHLELSLVDEPNAVAHMREAFRLKPDDQEIRVRLAETLRRERRGDEGANLEEAYALARDAVQLGSVSPNLARSLRQVFMAVGAYDEAAAVGRVDWLGRFWARMGAHTCLLELLSSVRTDEDRLELMHQHRIWGRSVEAWAQARPIQRPNDRSC